MTYFDLGPYSRKITTSSPDAQTLVRPGPQLAVRVQPLRSDQVLSEGAEPRRRMRHGALGHQLRLGPQLQSALGSLRPAWPADGAVGILPCHAGGPCACRQGSLGRAGDDKGADRAPSRNARRSRTWCLGQAYTVEMRKIFAAYPDDLEVRAVFAELIMNETPWLMRTCRPGAAEGAGTEECEGTCWSTCSRYFPAARDYLVFLASHRPPDGNVAFLQRALRAGDCLRQPSGLRPPHRYADDLDAPAVARQGRPRLQSKGTGDRPQVPRRIGRSGRRSAHVIDNFLIRHLRRHVPGQYTPAIAAAEELIATIPEAVLRIQSPPMADFLEGYLTMKQHVLVRFGKWREIIAQELPGGSRPLLLECRHDPLRQGGRAFGARQCRRGRDGEGIVHGGEDPGAREPPRPQQS